MKLTPRQQAAMNFIIRYKQANDGDSPTIREIMYGAGYSTTSAVSAALGALEARGLIERRLSGRRPAIAVKGGRWVYDAEAVV